MSALIVMALALDAGDALGTERDPAVRARIARDLARGSRDALEGAVDPDAAAARQALSVIAAALSEVGG